MHNREDSEEQTNKILESANLTQEQKEPRYQMSNTAKKDLRAM